jgi:phosphoserine phosphatase
MLSDHVTMAKEVYSTLIFDLDSTLYQNPELLDFRTELTIDWIAENANLGQKTPQTFYQNLSANYQHPYDLDLATLLYAR